MTVIISPEAEEDLAGIYVYIRERSGSPRIAIDYIRRIRKFCEQLRDFPERGTRRDDLSPRLRTMGFERRVSIAFSVQASGVTILRVLYGGRTFR